VATKIDPTRQQRLTKSFANRFERINFYSQSICTCTRNLRAILYWITNKCITIRRLLTKKLHRSECKKERQWTTVYNLIHQSLKGLSKYKQFNSWPNKYTVFSSIWKMLTSQTTTDQPTPKVLTYFATKKTYLIRIHRHANNLFYVDYYQKISCGIILCLQKKPITEKPLYTCRY